MLPLDTWRKLEWLAAWPVSGRRQRERNFYFSNRWKADFDALPGPEMNAFKPARSPKEIVGALAEAWSSGLAYETMIKPLGLNSHPVFKRLRPPRQIVVEMRTSTTRSFGFFANPHTYVALFLDCDVAKVKSGNLYASYGDDVLKMLKGVRREDQDGITDVHNPK